MAEIFLREAVRRIFEAGSVGVANSTARACGRDLTYVGRSPGLITFFFKAFFLAVPVFGDGDLGSPTLGGERLGPGNRESLTL